MRGNPPANIINMPFSLKATPRRRPEKNVNPAAKTCRANAFYIPARNNRTDNFTAGLIYAEILKHFSTLRKIPALKSSRHIRSSPQESKSIGIS